MRTKIPRSLPTMMRCRKCGKLLPAEQFELYSSGTRRHVCNKCKYLHYTLHLPTTVGACEGKNGQKRHKRRAQVTLPRATFGTGLFHVSQRGAFSLPKRGFSAPKTMLLSARKHHF